MFIVLFAILLSGLGLYVLLKPPALRIEELSVNDELYAEVTISNVGLPEDPIHGERSLTAFSANKE